MAKNIILCLDGTWNGPDRKSDDGSFTPTNVQKLFESLSGSSPLAVADDEREIQTAFSGDEPAQVGKYIHGVGDQSNVLARAVGGAVGAGLVARVIRGYTYLSRQYKPGDRVFIVGFSRGAYAARALGGLVASYGLLDWDRMQLTAGSEESYSAALAAWSQYKVSVFRNNKSVLREVAGAVTDLYDKIALGLHPSPSLQLVQNARIFSIAVWDTVGALGIPIVCEVDGSIVRADAFQFANTELHSSVSYGFHALAADEQRVDFTPTLWQERDGITQVIFPGAHCDVGGGDRTTQSGLSNGALAWMARKLAQIGLLFDKQPPGIPDPFGLQHCPWSGAIFYKTAFRHFPPGLLLSHRVLQRMSAKSVPIEGHKNSAYRPKNLVNSYVSIDWRGAAPHVEVEP